MRPHSKDPDREISAVPIHEYECLKCSHVSEFLIRGSGDEKLRCEKCGSTKLERRFSTFSAGGSKRSGGVCTTPT